MIGINRIEFGNGDTVEIKACATEVQLLEEMKFVRSDLFPGSRRAMLGRSGKLLVMLFADGKVLRGAQVEKFLGE